MTDTNGASLRHSFDLDALREAIVSLQVMPKHHGGMIEQLGKLYPALAFRTALDVDRGGLAHGRILTADGELISASARRWVAEQLDAAGGDVQAVYGRYGKSSLIRTARRFRTLYLVAPIGPRPEDFIQLQLEIWTEYRARHLLPDREMWLARTPRPEDLLELVYPDESSPPIVAPAYSLVRVDPIPVFLERCARLYQLEQSRSIDEMKGRVATQIDVPTGVERTLPMLDVFPEAALPRVAPLQRLMFDWEESSAGRTGTRFEDHWALELHEGREAGAEWCYAIPMWTIKKRLPDANKARPRGAAANLDWLHRFDEKAGHRFAWFFFLLHGNLVAGEVGEAIVRSGQVQQLPACDRTVLMRWYHNQYGF